MNLLAIALSISLPMQGGEFTGGFSVDVSPVVAVEAPTWLWRAEATALPGVVLYDPNASLEPWQETVRHELMHVDQQQALGPAFWLAYAATRGRPFEPHDDYYLVPSFTASSIEDMTVKETDYSQMWMPSDHMRGNFPVFRLGREGNTTRMQFLPGYPGVTFNLD